MMSGGLRGGSLIYCYGCTYAQQSSSHGPETWWLACVNYSTVRDGVLEIGFWDSARIRLARLDFLSGLRNRAIARLDFLSVTALPPLEKLRALLVF